MTSPAASSTPHAVSRVARAGLRTSARTCSSRAPQRVRDMRPDEAGAAGEQDGHSKFFQYLLAVGPRWPLYFDPSSAAPYGVVAGSVICMKEICPIFISG